jgi:hypothetical protein
MIYSSISNTINYGRIVNTQIRKTLQTIAQLTVRLLTLRPQGLRTLTLQIFALVNSCLKGMFSKRHIIRSIIRRPHALSCTFIH